MIDPNQMLPLLLSCAENFNGLYKLANGEYQTSYVNPYGARVRNRFQNYRDAKTKRTNLSRQLSELKAVRSHEPTVVFVNEYLAQNPKSPMAKRSSDLLKSFVHKFGPIAISGIRTPELADWFAKMKEAKGYSGRTMLQNKYAFTPFFDDLVEQGVIAVNPLSGIKFKKGTRIKERVFLSEREIKKILAGLLESSNQTYPVIYFMLHTGCKVGEALVMKWEQVDLENGTVRFNASPNSDQRTLHLSPPLWNFLRQHPVEHDYLFVTNDGLPWNSNKFGKRIAQDRIRVGLPKLWDTFAFRDTFAYHFLRNGGTLQQLQVVLGHRNISETISGYGSIMNREGEKLSPY